MQAMSRAIEDASDFMEMKRKLEQGMAAEKESILERLTGNQVPEMFAAPPLPPKRANENREQYRARVHGTPAA